MSGKEKVNKSRKIEVTKILDVTSIVKNIPFILFLSFLALAYIYNGHLADKLVRKISETENTLKEQNYELKTLKSKIIFRSKSSELMKAVAHMGLNETTETPALISEK